VARRCISNIEISHRSQAVVHDYGAAYGVDSSRWLTGSELTPSSSAASDVVTVLGVNVLLRVSATIRLGL